jgi:hypothetical protein
MLFPFWIIFFNNFFFSIRGRISKSAFINDMNKLGHSNSQTVFHLLYDFVPWRFFGILAMPCTDGRSGCNCKSLPRAALCILPKAATTSWF